MRRIVKLITAAMLTMCSGAWASVISGMSQEVDMTILPTGADVSNPILVQCPLLDAESVSATIDGTILLSATNDVEFLWQPQKKGLNKLVYTAGDLSLTTSVNVVGFDYFVQPEPNPPMEQNTNISIYPATDHFGTGGGGLVVSTSGSGTWTAVASEPWIALNSTSGTAGKGLAFRISATTNVEERTGYIYISGHVYTVTQDGLGATVDKSNETFEHNGGSGTVNVTAQNRIVWQARPNVDWIYVSPTSGSGEGRIEYQVAPFNEASTRQGTMTVAGNTVTVFQYGRRMKLATYKEHRDWYAHVIPVQVDALAITSWSVTPNASWISVVDGGNGKGGDLVSIAISENPSYAPRTGTVTIGTETFTVTQDGCTDLEISIDPVESEASVNGANTLLSVYATPDLPWTVTSDSSWVTIYDKFKNGAGNGNIVYTVTPNSTLYDRKAIVSVTPEKASGMPTRKHTVTQPAAESAISINGYEFEASGESCTVEVFVADIVEWKVEENLDWITINGSTSRMGSGTVVIQAAANDTFYPRSGTITIAQKTFTVTQKAQSVEVGYEEMLFNARGGYSSLSIHLDGNVEWTVEVSDDWIIIWGDESGAGDAEIEYIVDLWNDEGSSRTGWIKIGDKTIYITQRAYDLSISPNGKKVTGNNGAGEIGVSASIGDVWNAIVTEPWITIVDGYDSGTGSGTVRFIYTENNTGKTRKGKIIVAGEVYTLEQAARTKVSITATAGHGGKVSGGGSYDLGSEVTLTAIPDSGYKFSYWTGAVDSMQNPLKVIVDVAKSYTAVFEPLTFIDVLDESNLLAVETGGVAKWQVCGDDAKVGDSVAVSGEVADDDEEEQQSWISVKVEGKGTLSFWWRVDCEPDPLGRHTYDRGVLTIDDKDIDKKDGISGWMSHSVTFDTAGEHEIVLTYVSDGRHPVDDIYAGCMWADGFVWTPKEEFPILDESAAPEMVAQVLSDAVDAKLSANIMTAAEYSAFRAWVKGLSGTSQEQVKASPNAWLSYVLDTDSLIEGEMTDARVKVEEFAIGGDSNIFDMTLRVADTSVGTGVTVANLLRVFAVEGTASLADEDFSVEKVAVSFGEPDNGAIPLAVTPRETGSAFFVRTRLRDQLNGDRMNGCEVTFNLNGGGNLPEGMSAKRFVEYASTYGELPVPTREGYVFDGWYTAAEGGEKVTSATEMAIFASQTLYAKWEKEVPADTHAKVQLWEGGPYWATMNIGAEKPEDYGYYFWWGDIVGYKWENDKWVASDGSNSNFSFSPGNKPTYGKDISTLQSEGWITADGVLSPEHDAAQKHWGGDWRMPTKQEFADLISKCDWTRTTMNGVNGYVVCGKGDYASARIFFPYSGYGSGSSLNTAGLYGYCWSSVPISDNCRACYLSFASSGRYTHNNYRNYGLSVRPLQGFTK